jgi:hypothetical protein
VLKLGGLSETVGGQNGSSCRTKTGTLKEFALTADTIEKKA